MILRACGILCFFLSIATGLASAQTVTYRMGSATDLVDNAFYTGTAGGRAAFWGSMNHGGTTVAFYGVDYTSGFETEIYLVDVGDPSSWRKLTTGFVEIPQSLVTWSPDDSTLFIGSRRVDVVTGAVDQPQYFGRNLNDVTATALPANNWIFVETGELGEDNFIALPILNSGQPDTGRQPIFVTNFPAGTFTTVGLDWPGVAPDGHALAFATYAGRGAGVNDLSDVYILQNLTAILAAAPIPSTNISSLAPTTLSSPVTSIRVGGVPDNFAIAGAFSSDGSLLLYSEDWNNVFDNENFFNSFSTTDFEVMVSNSDGSGSDFRIVAPGNQGANATTPGGTRLIYVDTGAGGPLDIHCFISTLEVATTVAGTTVGSPADNTIVTTSPQTVQDGSGTLVTVPSSTTIDFPDGGPQEIQIETPIDPATDEQLPPGVGAIPVVRDFGPDGTTFNPPIDITISYTDTEIGLIDESTLQVYLFNDLSGIFDIPVNTITNRDTINNTITFKVTHFSVFGVGSPADTDQDGVGDTLDADDDNDGIIDNADSSPFDTDNDGLTNANDPDDDSDEINDQDDSQPYDTDNDGFNNNIDGDDDGDGMPDGLEADFGTDPLDAEDAPAGVPLSPAPVIVILLGLGVAVLAARKKLKTA
jgi:hypothetical protein